MAQSASNAQDLIEAAKPIEEWYAQLQGNFATVTAAGEDGPRLVDSRENADQPIHRWYSLKESFSYEMPTWLCSWIRTHYNHEPAQVLDPFLGSGTSGVSLGKAGLSVTGVEYNPFIRLVAMVKAMVSKVCAEELAGAVRALDRPTPDGFVPDVPKLTTLHNSDYISNDNLVALLWADCLVEQVAPDPDVRNLLRVGIAASIEEACNLRKDGRALRYIDGLAVQDVRPVIQAHWQAMLDDVQAYENGMPDCGSQEPLFKVCAGSAMDLGALRDTEGKIFALADGAFDTVMYSPPYLNGFDYSEVYKLELWLMRFLQDYETWKELRMGTVRSHWSVAFPETHRMSSDERTKALAEKIRELSLSHCIDDPKHRAALSRVICGYFDDMYQALKEQYRVLAPGGMLVYVVANSRYHYLPIATDVILGEIARLLGFEPLDLVILKKRNGRTRQKSFLHESAVFFRIPV